MLHAIQAEFHKKFVFRDVMSVQALQFIEAVFNQRDHIAFYQSRKTRAARRQKGGKPVQEQQDKKNGNDSNLLIVFYVQIMPDDLVMQLHRF